MPLVIDEVYLFVSVDDEGEGVVAAELPGMPGLMVPLVAADDARMMSLLPIARDIQQRSGKRVKLVRFETRTVVKDGL